MMVSFANQTSVEKPSKQHHGFETCAAIVVCVSVHPLQPSISSLAITHVHTYVPVHVRMY